MTVQSKGVKTVDVSWQREVDIYFDKLEAEQKSLGEYLSQLLRDERYNGKHKNSKH